MNVGAEGEKKMRKCGLINGQKCSSEVFNRYKIMMFLTRLKEPYFEYNTQSLIEALKTRRMEFFSKAENVKYFYYPYTGRMEVIDNTEERGEIEKALQKATLQANAMGYDRVMVRSNGLIMAANNIIEKILDFSEDYFWIVEDILQDEEDIIVKKSDSALIIVWN